jgi:hypothetical protein
MTAASQVTPSDREIPLRDAPEHFFDPAKWCEYLFYFEDREKGLAWLSRAEPNLIAYTREEAAKIPTSEGEDARRGEKAAELGRSLLAAFKERLINGQLIATGLCALDVDRVRIPGDRWPDLWPNFIDSRADGDLTFTAVRIRQPTDPPQVDDLLTQCIEWLRKRRKEGGGLKKGLRAEALKHFGAALKTRIFDQAYKVVFAKARGRPRIGTAGPDEDPGSQTADQGEPPPAKNQPPTQKSAPGMVRLIAPTGCSHVQGMDGRYHMVNPDGTFEVSEADAKVFLQAGYVSA